MPDVTRIAVVGFGLVGKRHAESIRRLPDLRLAAIVEPDDEARASATAMGAPCFATLDEMFDRTEVDGVILATPTPLHVEQGLTCIEMKCPLLVEKPIAVTAQEARVLVDAAEAAQVPLLVGHHRRHNGMVRAAKSAIAAGAIGELRAIQATCWFYKPDHYFEAAPWRMRKGAGPVSVNLVHDADLLRHFCGEVARVQAQSVPSARGFENEDLAAALLTFKSGVVATISVADTIVAPWSWELTARENPAYPATNESCYLVGGSRGSLSIPDLRVWSHENEPDWWSPISAKTLVAGTGDPLSVQAAHFSNVILGQEAPLVSGLDGLRSLQIVEAVQRAAETGNPIEINPMKNTDSQVESDRKAILI
ncbi:Gfo/Idh/MocA family protein [Hoeflea sp. TYP-13]|uniref:Gfo/Idh/MocA family protein n=1 Tax=Hoeflea sp. TYP-13 TaxID=3230023 RepID=UPI0034C6A4A1